MDYDLRLPILPANPEEEVDGWRFDAAELAALTAGEEVIAEVGDDRFYITAPGRWAAIFGDTEVPALQVAIFKGNTPAEVEAAAVEFRAQHVSAENCFRHRIDVMPLIRVPSWHGKTRHDVRIHREKDWDLCTWENAQGF